jgi:hypothetical protein
MKRVVVLVEGQTEEALVDEVLAPAALARGVHLAPVIVITSATPAGARRGGGSWRHYDTRLRNLFKASHLHRVGLLIDYYQYPRGAPGCDVGGSGPARQSELMARLHKQYPDSRFRPLVVLHEIEALVLAAIDAGRGEGLIPARGLTRLRREIARAGGPERIDHGPSTAPSKRLLRADPGYLKTVTGPLLVAEAGLSAVLARCPTFAAWWEDLLS